MKHINKWTVFVLALLVGSLVFAVKNDFWRPLGYRAMPGTYQCKDFGLPNDSFSKLQITPEMKLLSFAADQTFTVGRLAPRESGAELEFSMETVHFPTFTLDPFVAPQLVVYRNALVIEAKRAGQVIRETCVKINP